MGTGQAVTSTSQPLWEPFENKLIALIPRVVATHVTRRITSSAPYKTSTSEATSSRPLVDGFRCASHTAAQS
jgi:hypothetical protein